MTCFFSIISIDKVVFNSHIYISFEDKSKLKNGYQLLNESIMSDSSSY